MSDVSFRIGEKALLLAPVEGVPRGTVVSVLHYYPCLEKWFVLAPRLSVRSYAPSAYVRSADLRRIG